MTRDCFYVDPRRGVARLYARDEAGRAVLDDEKRSILKREARGRVQVLQAQENAK